MTTKALGAAINQIRRELLAVLHFKTDQLNGIAVAMQQSWVSDLVSKD